MPTKNIPYAVARWFADGEGWAYDQAFSGSGGLLGLTSALDDVLKTPLQQEHNGELKFERQGLQGWLIGTRVPDRNVLDRLAANRGPSILRVAYVAGQDKPSDELKGEILKRLREVLPARQGAGDLSFEVKIPDPILLAPPVGDNGYRDFRGAWRSMVSRWQELVNEREYAGSFLSTYFTAERIDGKMAARADVLQNHWRPAGAAQLDHPGLALVASENRVLIAGPCPAGANEYVVQVYEARDDVMTILLHRHLTVAPPEGEGARSSSVWQRITGGGHGEEKSKPSKEHSGLREKITATWAGFQRLRAFPRQVLKSEVGKLPVTQEDHWLLTLALMIPF